MEDRIRAFIRWKMVQRGLGVTAAAKHLDADQGHLSKILLGTRGVSAGLAFRVSQKFTIELEHLFHRNPPEEFWREHVPRACSDPTSASPAPSAQPTRRQMGAGGKKDVH